MSRQAKRVHTVFLHEYKDGFRVVATRNNSKLFEGVLELTETDAGPRPRQFRIKEGSQEEPRAPDQFIEIARRASKIRISKQTSDQARKTLQSMLSGYQLEAKVVRTCRLCAQRGEYTPITDKTAIKSGDEYICPECAKRQLRREQRFHGELSAEVHEQLEDLLLETQDLDQIIELLQGSVDPGLTKFDEISATTDEIETVAVEDLSVNPRLQNLLDDRFDTLLPVQSLAINNGLLNGNDQLIVSATATGKTLIGEIAGINRMLHGNGKFLFLVPLVALANQKYTDFSDQYGHLGEVTIRVGASRIRDEGNQFDPNADIIIGTYEGIDHALRTGKDLGNIGTIVIDEVHNIKEPERGHRVDGLIARLKYYCQQRQQQVDDYSGCQWVYLSATVGNPTKLAKRLGAHLIEFEERPVPIERHLTFASEYEKPDIENKLVKQEFDQKSSKGYRGQTIIFTNSRRRCHDISRKLDYSSAAYHAGLNYSKRKRIEDRFANQEIAAVVTTAALGAGVDFPASQVIFDALAMGIEWLSVQEFQQMLGRAGRPDYHDRGKVYLLVEPDGTYHANMEMTEDQIAFKLLKDEMEDVIPTYDESAVIAETLANITVGGTQARQINNDMVGSMPTKHALGKLLEYEFIDGLEPTPLGRAVTTHFLEPEEAFILLQGIRNQSDPFDLVAERELMEDD